MDRGAAVLGLAFPQLEQDTHPVCLRPAIGCMLCAIVCYWLLWLHAIGCYGCK